MIKFKLNFDLNSLNMENKSSKKKDVVMSKTNSTFLGI